MVSRLRAAVNVLVVSAATSAAVGTAAWHFLPYDALERASAADRFVLWEAAMWFIGLALALFGSAAWFGSTDLSVRHGDAYLDRTPEHIRRQVQQGVSGRTLFSDLPAVPWLMIGTGLGMGLQAAIGRAIFLN